MLYQRGHPFPPENRRPMPTVPPVHSVLAYKYQFIVKCFIPAVAMSSANGLVDTRLANRYRLQPRVSFKGSMGRCEATTPSSLSLTSNRVTANY